MSIRRSSSDPYGLGHVRIIRVSEDSKGETFIIYELNILLGWDSMGLGSGKFSEGSRSLFGSISIPNLKKSEFADALRSGMGQITDLAKRYSKNGDVHSFVETVKANQARSRGNDMGAYGFESFQVGDDIEVFVRDTPVEEIFRDSETKFEPVVSMDAGREAEAPAEQPVTLEDFAADFEGEIAQIEEAKATEPVVEHPKLEEFMDQPVIIRPEFIEDAEVPAEAEEVDMYVGEAPVAAADFEPSSLFGNIKRGMSEEVDTHVGLLQDGFIKETAPNVTLDDFDMFESVEEIQAEDAAIDEMELIDAQFPEVPAAVETVYVERAVPKLEDFIIEEPEIIAEVPVVEIPAAVPEWDVTEECAETFADYISMIPEETTWEIAPVWEVTDEAADAFLAFGTIRPEYPKAVAAVPEWDIKADTFADYLSFIPEETTWEIAPEWDVTEECAETFADYISMIPEETTWDVAPVWDVTDDAAEAFIAFGTIRPEYPKAVAAVPEWDVAEASAETFADYISMIPEETTWEIAPVWEVTDEAADAFLAFGTIRPEYPKAVAVIPEWDVTDAAVEGFEGYRMAEDDLIKSAMFVAATVSVSRIDIDPIDRQVTDAVAAASGETGTIAETNSASGLLIPVKDNAAINQENLQIVPEGASERKVRTSRFVFKDGKLQKITEEVVIAEDIPMTIDSATVSEEQPTGTVEPSVFALPAAQSFSALPAPSEVDEGAQGVRFSFGQSRSGYGTVRFTF